MTRWKCPECGEASDIREWEISKGCKECGEHPARICPKCSGYIDMEIYREEDFAVLS